MLLEREKYIILASNLKVSKASPWLSIQQEESDEYQRADWGKNSQQ